jgi:hypothetical protein
MTILGPYFAWEMTVLIIYYSLVGRFLVTSVTTDRLMHHIRRIKLRQISAFLSRLESSPKHADENAP